MSGGLRRADRVSIGLCAVQAGIGGAAPFAGPPVGAFLSCCAFAAGTVGLVVFAAERRDQNLARFSVFHGLFPIAFAVLLPVMTGVGWAIGRARPEFSPFALALLSGGAPMVVWGCFGGIAFRSRVPAVVAFLLAGVMSAIVLGWLVGVFSLLVSVAVWQVGVAAAMAGGMWRLARREARPAWVCRSCGYDTRGARRGVCPECGAGAGLSPGSGR